jgi:hypothetical protein
MKGKQAVIRARRARRAGPPPDDGSPRERLLQAAFAEFREHVVADASTRRTVGNRGLAVLSLQARSAVPQEPDAGSLG